MVRDVRQKGKGPRNDDARKKKVINMIGGTSESKKRKTPVA